MACAAGAGKRAADATPKAVFVRPKGPRGNPGQCGYSATTRAGVIPFRSTQVQACLPLIRVPTIRACPPRTPGVWTMKSPRLGGGLALVRGVVVGGAVILSVIPARPPAGEGIPSFLPGNSFAAATPRLSLFPPEEAFRQV